MRDRPDPDALLSASQLAEWFEISVQLIGMWRHKGHLKVSGWRGRYPLYRYGDAEQVETRMARRAIYANNHRARRVA